MESESRQLTIASGLAIMVAIAAITFEITTARPQSALEQDAVEALPEMQTLHEGGAVAIREVVMERVEQRQRRERNFRVQLIVSAVLGAAALYIILAPKNRFDAGTRRWAFGVLNMIAGAFIGTAIAA